MNSGAHKSNKGGDGKNMRGRVEAALAVEDKRGKKRTEKIWACEW
jgi:hypothetical protein